MLPSRNCMAQKVSSTTNILFRYSLSKSCFSIWGVQDIGGQPKEILCLSLTKTIQIESRRERTARTSLKESLTTPTPIFAKNMPPKYAIQWGSVLHKSPSKSRDSTANMAYGPKNMATNPPLLCHMNRFYRRWGWPSIC